MLGLAQQLDVASNENVIESNEEKTNDDSINELCPIQENTQYTTQMQELLSQIQAAQRQFTESKQTAMDEQHSMLDKKYQDMLTQQQSVMEQHRSDVKREWDQFHRTASEEMETL